MKLRRKILKKVWAGVVVLTLVTQMSGISNLEFGIKNNTALANDMCSVDTDTILIMDRSGSMADGQAQSSCKWWEFKWMGSSFQWVFHTDYNVTKEWCDAKSLPPNRTSTFTPATLSKIQNAKNAADTFLDNFKSNDQSALVSYATTATLDKTLSNNHASTLTAVNALTPLGATNIGDAIKLGIQELSSTRARAQATKAMVLLTDGLANKPNGDGLNENPLDVAYAESQATIAAGLGYKIFTVGLGDDGQIDQVMLQNIATITGANYHHVPNGEDLSPIYQEISTAICQYGSISGCLNEDKNNNATLDTGEQGLSGWEVVLSTGTSTTLYQDTDTNGCFQFAGLTDGSYSVFEGPNLDKGDFVITHPQSQIYTDVVIANHNNITAIDFLNYLPSCGNSITDTGEQCDDGNLTDGDGCSATCTTELPACEPVYESRVCVSSGRANVTYGWNHSSCGNDYIVEEDDSLCACQASDTGAQGECVADGQRQHYFTYNYDYCEADYEESQADASCDCVASESARECVGDGSAKVTYSYNYDFCGSDYTETKEDLSCGSEYECSSWQDESCVDNALRQQTRTCEDQYGTSYPDSRSISDDTCGCQSTETDRTCAGDGYADVSFTYNFGYCGLDYQDQETDSSCGCAYNESSRVCASAGFALVSYSESSGNSYCAQKPAEEIADSSCGGGGGETCEYSTWQDGQCNSNGFRQQTRTQTNTLDGCTDLTQNISDTSCGCVETEVSGSCTDTTHREFTFTYNFEYCAQKPAEQRVDSSCGSGGGGETCEYSTWQDGQCNANGFRQQTRTQTNTLDGCTDLTQNISDTSCGCVETEVSGSCTDTTHREFTFTYNFSYCTKKDSEQRIDSSCNTGGGGGGGSVILPPIVELNIFNEGENVGGDVAHFTWETNLNSNSIIIYSAEDEGHVFNKNNPALYGYANSYKNPNDDLGVVLHSVDIPWLRACMVYYYRAVSEAGSVGTAFGNERSFKTPCLAAIVEPLPSGVGGPTGELGEVKVVVPVVEEVEEVVTEPTITPEEIVQENSGFLASLANLLNGFGGTCFHGFPWWLILVFALYPTFKIYEAYKKNKKNGIFSWFALLIIHLALAASFYFASVLIVFIWVFLAIGFANFFTNYFVSFRKEEDKNKFLVELLTILLLEILLLTLGCLYLWLVLFILLICLAITLSFKNK
jgi:cysteine-rich repeat protein